MMNKKGTLVLRDIVFMMLMVSAIFIFCGIFVSDMANSYSNSNMSSEWVDTGTATLGNSTFYDTVSGLSDKGEELKDESGGFWDVISGAVDAIGSTIALVFSAPALLANLVGSTLTDMGAGETVGNVITYLIAAILYGIIIFTIVSLFSKGGINV